VVGEFVGTVWCGWRVVVRGLRWCWLRASVLAVFERGWWLLWWTRECGATRVGDGLGSLGLLARPLLALSLRPLALHVSSTCSRLITAPLFSSQLTCMSYRTSHPIRYIHTYM
jgi:hypothetical protein